MKFLTLEQLLALHALVTQESGGSSGLRDLGRLEAAVASQTQNVFGEELYGTIYGKAAAIIRGIVADHPFVDGNKRTAMLAGLTLLQINNAILRLKQGDIEDFAVYIATDKLDVKIIADWLKEHTA